MQCPRAPVGGILSWLLSGIAFVQAPLAYTFSATGIVIWLVLVVMLSVVASVLLAPGGSASVRCWLANHWDLARRSRKLEGGAG